VLFVDSFAEAAAGLGLGIVCFARKIFGGGLSLLLAVESYIC
jgi:hypothetical protein